MATAVVVAVLAVALSGPDASGTGAGRSATEPPTWDQVLTIRDELGAAARSNDYPVDQATLAAVATAPGPYTPLGRIAFPTTGLDVEFGAGVQPSVLERGPGHWPGTALPGQAGNMVVSGHRTTWTSPFRDLDLLTPGDPIALTPPDSGPVVYRVVETTTVPEAGYADFVLGRPADPAARVLTLFACAPKGDRTHRIVVRATAQSPGGS
ncbi:class E sortase [Pseudonocardia nematodicida]|uniref:Class E sortase n=1 Tax=Pseudonocardia nematodicida TaxID=1206997 RepID=A0ABV1KCA8_9PSEU